MPLLNPKTYTLSDVIVASVAVCIVGGTLFLFLHSWLKLSDTFERGAIIAIELGAAIFTLFLIMFFMSLLIVGVTRVFKGKR